MKTRDMPATGGEKEMLQACLDNQRAIVQWKLEGVTPEQGQSTTGASATSLFGLVKHLSLVELGWLVNNFLGEEFEHGYDFDADRDAEWRPDPADTAESVLAGYEAAIARANQIIADADLDDLASRPLGKDRGHASMRWILVHMIEETARHAGHADIMRELVDGERGYLPENLLLN